MMKKFLAVVTDRMLTPNRETGQSPATEVVDSGILGPYGKMALQNLYLGGRAGSAKMSASST